MRWTKGFSIDDAVGIVLATLCFLFIVVVILAIHSLQLGCVLSNLISDYFLLVLKINIYRVNGLAILVLKQPADLYFKMC